MRFFKNCLCNLAFVLGVTIASLTFLHTQKSLAAGTALIVAVDVSSSVDAESYKLQMEGIAAALEDKAVVDTILNGPAGGILFTLVTWANHPRTAIPWTKIDSYAKAKITAERIRKLPQIGGQYTCVTRMFRHVIDKVIPQIPGQVLRTVLDVSGDGRENCNPHNPISMTRDEVINQPATINGLPILQGSEGDVIEQWYRDNVIGGPGAFVVPANGFEDFGRAIRQKFVFEISGKVIPRKLADVQRKSGAEPTQ
ncbi:MAG: DUF1194 domain-containing protein [Hyphomicrobiaceae bacterium]